MRQEYLRAAAEAYANITPLQSDCYHYLNDGFDTSIQAELHDAYSALLLSKSVPDKYIYKIVCTALAECRHPIDESTGYAWTGNQRAAFCNIPKATWSRNNLSIYTNFILDNMTRNANTARAAIQLQVTGYE